MSAFAPMRQPIRLTQRELEPAWRLDRHMRELAGRYGVKPASTLPRIGGPVRASVQHSQRGPYVRAEAVRALLRPLIAEHGISRVAWWSCLGERALYRVMNEIELVSVAVADILICKALDDPSLWASPGLEYVNQKGEPWRGH